MFETLIEVETGTEDTLELTNLVERLKIGDEKAFQTMYEQFCPVVRNVLFKLNIPESSHDDMMQDIFFNVFRKISHLRDPERFPGWLQKTAIRFSINFHCGRKGDKSFHSSDVASWNIEDFRANMEGLNLQIFHEDIVNVRRATQGIGEIYRQALEAFYLKGMTLKEMSDYFNHPIGTIKRRLHTARSRLRVVLEENGMSPD